MSLESLPSVSKLSDIVVRVLGQNPGKFSLQGTNTYLVGKRPPWILVDAGEGKAEYEPLLQQTLRQQETPNTPLISDIIVTHRHGDHHGGLPSVLALLRRLWGTSAIYPAPRIHKFPLPTESTFIRKSTSTIDTSLETTYSALAAQPELYTAPAVSQSQSPYFHNLVDQQVLVTQDGSASLKVLHTPGHTTDSISLLLVEEHAFFTGDTVLGHGTAVFEDLAQYMRSLHLLKAVQVAEGGVAASRIYPGHGAVVEDGPRLLGEYIKHRQDREDQIVELLKTAPQSVVHGAEAEAMWTIDGVVQTVYASYPQSVWPAAAHGVALHLLKLEEEGLVRRDKRSEGPKMRSDQWRLVRSAL